MAWNKRTVALCSIAAVAGLALAAAVLRDAQVLSALHDRGFDVPAEWHQHLPGHVDINQVLAALPR